MERPVFPAGEEVARMVRLAVAEDVGGGDATTLALVPEETRMEAVIVTRQECVVCGGPVAGMVFATLDPAVTCTARIADGERAAPGDTLVCIEGPARPILAGERTALNFMQRLSGIATLTRRFADLAAPYGLDILDTRKTTPNLRVLEKYAVQCGGGRNHRMGLYDRILIKDNHRRLCAGEGGRLGLGDAVVRARRAFPDLAIEVEVETEAEAADALAGAPDWILLDNMEPERMKRVAALCGGRVKLEASGGITLETVEKAAASGVDAISLGCLTHSAASVDLSLEIACAATGGARGQP